MAEDRQSRLADLLADAASAHHAYEVELGRADPGWPEWYARWLVEHGLGELMAPAPDVATLEHALVTAEKEYEEQDPDEPWEAFYADYLLSHLRGS